MSIIIGLINYGIAGNTTSIKRAIEAAGANVVLVTDSASLSKVDKIVLPGVGSFSDAIDELNTLNIIDELKEQAKNKPVLGICLGMQILATVGFEFGETKGLDFVDAEVRKVKCHGEVPHMGFNSIEVVTPNPLLDGLNENEFYFMHSYEMINYTNVSSLTNYHGHQFVSSIQKNNIYGVQFHPEKSREAGIQLFRNFIAL
jgi:glutamine amidotransferase